MLQLTDIFFFYQRSEMKCVLQKTPPPHSFFLEKKITTGLKLKSLFESIQMRIYYTYVGINNVNYTASSCWLFIH